MQQLHQAPDSQFFSRFTHRTTHVASHKRWLERKGCVVLPDWDDAGALDCMYGALLKAAFFNNVKLVEPGENPSVYCTGDAPKVHQGGAVKVSGLQCKQLQQRCKQAQRQA
jgi:hypothetical protein